ncbi:MAG: histidine--tRNA ligase [Christensenellales bacterium]
MIQAPKGTKDCLPGESYLWQTIEAKMHQAARRAGYREVRTPVFEHTELFLRGVGDTTDIVQKEMYTFKDKGDRSITLKPEGTAGAARAMIEGKLYAEPLPVKMYYVNNPIFRYENPQHGRLREHHQFGMECFGARAPSADAEMIITLLSMLEAVGLDGLTVNINSIGCPVCRPAYHSRLKDFLGANVDKLCQNCRERFDRNPLRVLDCKEAGCKAIVRDAPTMLDMLCGECSSHFEGLQRLLRAAHVSFKIDSHIVRGLDYYTKTVFEIIMQDEREGLALCGGGRYDGLVEQIGGPALHGVGFGIGMERILMALQKRGLTPPAPLTCQVYLAHIDEAAFSEAFMLTQQIRALGISADCDHTGRSLKAQFKYANKLGATLIALVGGEELARGIVKLRSMASGEERELPLDGAASLIAAEARSTAGGNGNG